MRHSKSETRNYFIFVAFFVAMSFVIMKSFLFGILWAVVLAVSLWPILERLSQKKIFFIREGAQHNALFFTIVFSAIFLIPISYAVYQIAELYTLTSAYISSNTTRGGVFHYPGWFEKLPAVMKSSSIAFWTENIATSQRLTNFISQMNTDKMFSFLSIVWSQIVDRLITVTIMIISLYFMIRNGKLVQDSYKSVFAYWFSEKSLVYIKNGILAIRGTINGVLLLGIVEGIVLGLPLVFGGISSGLTIGLMAGIIGVIPFVMPLIILPFIAYLYFIGESLWASIAAIDLFFIWFYFEHVTKPKIISKTVKVNTFITLISMVGGMQLLGLVGLFLGPAIVAMAVGMIKELIRTPLRDNGVKKESIKIETEDKIVEATTTVENK